MSDAADVEILRGRPEQQEELTRTVATSFHPLDVCQWLVPDPQERAERFQPYFGIVTEHALRHGIVEYTPGFTGVAVWLKAPFPDIDDYDEKLAAAAGPWLERFQALDEQFHHAHPMDAPHGYLAFLGVLEGHQGKGIGTALLNHRLAEFDAEGLPTYLESSNPRSLRLYERVGYRRVNPDLDLPYQGEPMTPVWRDAQ